MQKRLAGMTRLELANQLIENQPAFHFAFIPTKENWYRRRDSNPHCLVSKTSASYQLGYAGMVDLARFERATSTFAESRSHSAELQVRKVWRKGQGLEPASDMCAVVFRTTALPV